VTELERPGGDTPTRFKRQRSWPWIIVGVVLAAGKVEALGFVEHHRVVTIVALAIGLAVAALRVNPVGIAVGSSLLLAWALAPPILLGIPLALGLFVLLMTLFYAISTVLHARQDRGSPGPRGRARSR
jgi:hypothetical protein